MSTPSVIFMGSKPGSLVALDEMMERGWNIERVVVSKENPHPWMPGSDLRSYALDKGLAVCIQGEVPSEEADFVISYMYRNRVERHTLDLAKIAAVNFHAGPLPGFGGWAFYNVAILEDAKEYGCTCHHMDEDFDTGDVLKVNRFPIDSKAETALSLEKKAQAEMLRLFTEFCDLVESRRPLPRTPQDPAKMRYLKKEEFMALKEIPLNVDEEAFERHARAFWYPPYECAYVRWGNRKVEVIPKIVKQQLAHSGMGGDLEDLRRVRTRLHDRPAQT